MYGHSWSGNLDRHHRAGAYDFRPGVQKHALRPEHNKLAVALSLLGMPRQKAATSLIVRYRVHVGPTGEQTVEFLEGTDIRVVRDADLGDHVAINVDVDKNVNALKRRQGFVPDEVPALGLSRVAMLERYLPGFRV